MNERDREISFGFCYIQNKSCLQKFKKLIIIYTSSKRNVSNERVVSLYKLIELKTISRIIIMWFVIWLFILIKIFTICKYNKISFNYIRIINIIIYKNRINIKFFIS